MKITISTQSLSFTVFLAIASLVGCGGGPDDPATETSTSACTATPAGVAAHCTTPETETDTSTNTGSQTSITTNTKTNTGTATNTGTVTTVTIPDWFKVQGNYLIVLTETSGAEYSNIVMIVSTINTDGTWSAQTKSCEGKCVGVSDIFAGTISTNSFKAKMTLNDPTAVNATGSIPAMVAQAKTSGPWNFNGNSGTFALY